MRYPQILVYESDGRLAELLRREQSLENCSLREPRRMESCLRLLAGGCPSVLVLKAGRDLIREMTLLERVCSLYPAVTQVVIEEIGTAALVGLGWQLGAVSIRASLCAVRELVYIVWSFLSGAATI